MLNIHWAHSGPSFVASFLACLVECVEALTVVLAVGSVRSWSGALSGSVTAVAVLLALIAALGNTLTRIPLHTLQLVVGALLLLFGLRWLRKAILRSAGQIPLHDEQAAFAKNAAAMRKLGGVRGWDRVAFAAAFQITMLEGTEVVFIVIAIGAGGAGLLVPASVGALAALLLGGAWLCTSSASLKCSREQAEVRGWRSTLCVRNVLGGRGNGALLARRGLVHSRFGCRLPCRCTCHRQVVPH